MSLKKPTPSIAPGSAWLTGQLLVAMPAMSDPRFERSVIYMCSHSPNGAMGLVINRLFDEVDFRMVLDQLDIRGGSDMTSQRVFCGGPVEMGRGFVLHSDDCLRDGSVEVDDGIALSATVEMLQLVADGNGPQRSLMALGYSGWGPGQLEREVRENGWLTVAADQDLVFETDPASKWERALAKIGISPELLSADAGHA